MISNQNIYGDMSSLSDLEYLYYVDLKRTGVKGTLTLPNGQVVSPTN